MKVRSFVISLRRSPGRRALMEQTLAVTGLDAEFVDAVDLQSTSEETLLEHCKSFGPWGFFAPGNMACTISHAKVWQALLASDADVALILEDDVFLSKDLPKWVDDLSWWPKGCALASLEFWQSSSMRVVLGCNTDHHMGREIAPMLSRYPGAAGYMLTRNGAELLLAQAPYDMTVDALLFNPLVSHVARELHPVQITPALVKQGNTPAGEESFLGHKSRQASGALLRRQKRMRAIAELRAVPRQLVRLALGRARLARVAYAENTETEALITASPRPGATN